MCLVEPFTDEVGILSTAGSARRGASAVCSSNDGVVPALISHRSSSPTHVASATSHRLARPQPPPCAASASLSSGVEVVRARHSGSLADREVSHARRYVERCGTADPAARQPGAGTTSANSACSAA
jgi:hypothetical protein